MARLVINELARETISAIVRDRRANVGFLAARALRERIMNGIYRIRDFPDANIRQLSLPPYRILYESADDTVTILAIVHGHSIFPEVERDDLSPEDR